VRAFWHSQGGGERDCATVGVVLARSGVEVDTTGQRAEELDEDASAARRAEIAARHDLLP
jgi:hypothetical protein